MSVIKFKGSALDPKFYVIAHQCNTVSGYKGGGFHQQVEEVFTILDEMHAKSTQGDLPSYMPGQVEVIQQDEKLLVNMYGQIYSGDPNPIEADGTLHRKIYFALCLDELRKRIETDDYLRFLTRTYGMVVPHGIGCGIGGGNWKEYKAMLAKFAMSADITLFIAKLPKEDIFSMVGDIDMPDSYYDF
jgi:hypothetical protein